MPDDLDLDARLAALGSGPAPALPGAAAARERGAQRTRRGRALLAGTGAALTALAVLGGSTLASPDLDRRQPDVLDIASAEPAPAEDPVRAALLDPEDLSGVRSGPWSEQQSRSGPPAALPTDCGTRPFGVSAPQQGDTGTAHRQLRTPTTALLTQQVLAFGDAERARAALSRLVAAVRTCPADGVTVRPLGGPEQQDPLLQELGVELGSVRLQVVGPEGDEVVAVSQVGPVLTAVRLAGWGEGTAEALPVVAELAAAEVREAGLAVPSPPVTPAPEQTPGLTAPGVSPTRAPASGVAQDALLDPEDTAAVEEGDWQPDAEPAPERLLDPCAGGTAYPQDAAVVERAAGSLTVRREAGGTTVRQEAWRYRTGADAVEALAGYQRAVLGCPEEPGDSPTVTTVYELVRPAEEGLLVRVTGVCEGCVPYPTYLAALQDGDAVLVLAVAVGEDGDPGVPLVQRYLDAARAELERARS